MCSGLLGYGSAQRCSADCKGREGPITGVQKTSTSLFFGPIIEQHLSDRRMSAGSLQKLLWHSRSEAFRVGTGVAPDGEVPCGMEVRAIV